MQDGFLDPRLREDDTQKKITSKIENIKKARMIKEILSQEKVCRGFTRQDLEVIAEPFIKKTLVITQDVFHEAGLLPKDIQGVVHRNHWRNHV